MTTELRVDLTQYAQAAGDPKQLLTMAEQATLAVEQLRCTNEAEYTTVTSLLKKCKGQIDTWESERKRLTKPILEAKRAIDAWFNSPKKLLQVCERQLKKKVADYHAALEQQQQALIPQMQQAHAEGNFATAIALSQSVPQTPSVSGVSVSERWVYDVVDPAQVPRELLAINDQAVRAAIRDGARQIPGLRIYAEKQVRSSKA